MFQFDDQSTPDSLIHVCFDWMTMHKLPLPNDGHPAKLLVPHICFTDPAADMLTHLTKRPKISATRPRAVTLSGHNACNADIESQRRETRSCATGEEIKKNRE